MKNIYLVCPDVIGHISPEIYGHFAEQLGGLFYGGLWVGEASPIPNECGFRKDALDLLRRIKPAVLRWPGGCFAEVYDWQDGIGENRPVRPSWWTFEDGRYEGNEVGTHEFFKLCELIGAKAYLAVNVTSTTPQNIRNWIDYCISPRGSTTLARERERNGHPEPFDLPFIGVGNENWGGGGNMTPDSYALEYRRYATVINNLTRYRSELIAGGANSAAYDWTQGLVRNLFAGDSPINGMSFHHYTQPVGDAIRYTDDEWYGLLRNAKEVETLIRRHHAVTVAYGMQDRMRLVIDEWGAWHPGGSGPSKGKNLFEQQSTMRDAMVAALTFNIFNNHCDKVRMANIAQLCNVIQSLLLIGDEGCVPTPTYHVFDLYKAHQGGSAIRAFAEPCEDGRKTVSVSASQKDGILTVTLANPAIDEDVEVSLNLFGHTLPTSAEVTILAAEDVRAVNSFDEPNRISPKIDIVDPREVLTIPKAGIAAVTMRLFF